VDILNILNDRLTPFDVVAVLVSRVLSQGGYRVM